MFKFFYKGHDGPTWRRKTHRHRTDRQARQTDRTHRADRQARQADRQGSVWIYKAADVIKVSDCVNL